MTAEPSRLVEYFVLWGSVIFCWILHVMKIQFLCRLRNIATKWRLLSFPLMELFSGRKPIPQLSTGFFKDILCSILDTFSTFLMVFYSDFYLEQDCNILCTAEW